MVRMASTKECEHVDQSPYMHQSNDKHFADMMKRRSTPDDAALFCMLRTRQHPAVMVPTSSDSSCATGGGTPGKQPRSSSLYIDVPATKMRKPTT